MERKSIIIDIPDGMCIDESKSTFEKIVFKNKENAKPRSWEEYCDLQITNNKKGYCINDLTSEIDEVHWYNCANADSWRNVLPSRELAEASRAMMQLMSIRQEWIGGWKPCWNGISIHFCIAHSRNGYSIDKFALFYHVLSFPTQEMAKDFMNCFRDLLEVAKPLI